MTYPKLSQRLGLAKFFSDELSQPKLAKRDIMALTQHSYKPLRYQKISGWAWVWMTPRTFLIPCNSNTKAKASGGVGKITASLAIRASPRESEPDSWAEEVVSLSDFLAFCLKVSYQLRFPAHYYQISLVKSLKIDLHIL